MGTNMLSNFMKNVFSKGCNYDVRCDRRLTVGRLSGLEAKCIDARVIQVNPRITLIRFAFALLLFLSLGVGNVWGAEEVIYTLTPATGGTNAYASLSEDIDCEDKDNEVTIRWNAVGNTTVTPWRIGGKSISNAVRVIYSETALSNNVTKVVVSYGSTFSLTSASAVLKVYSTAEAAASGDATYLISSVNGDNGAKPSSNVIARQ